MEIISEFNKTKAIESIKNLETITKTAETEFAENNLKISKNPAQGTKKCLKRKITKKPNKNGKKAKLVNNNTPSVKKISNIETRKSPRLNKHNFNGLFTLLAIIMKLTLILGLEITSDFNYCDNSEKV
jgi:hypothetical protein